MFYKYISDKLDDSFELETNNSNFSKCVLSKLVDTSKLFNSLAILKGINSTVLVDNRTFKIEVY